MRFFRKNQIRKCLVLVSVFLWCSLSVTSADQVDRLIQLLEKGPPKKKAFAANALAEIGDIRGIEPLIMALTTKNNYLRSYYTQALADFGEDALEPLLKACSHKKMRIRGNAANALGKIREDDAVDTLISLLDDKKTFVRKSAIIALTNFRGRKIMKAKIALLQREKKASLRSYLVKALGTYKKKEVIPPLETATKDSDAFVRKDATRSLGNLGFAEVTPILIEALGDADEEVQGVGAEGLIKLGKKNPEAFKLLLETMGQPGNPVLLANVARVLGEVGNVEAVPALISAVSLEGASKVMLPTIASLGNLKDKRAVEPLLTMLDSFDDPVRRATVEALGKVGDKSITDKIIPVLKDYDEMTRMQAIVVLGGFGDRSAIDALKEVADNDKKEQVRSLAEEIIKRLKEGR